MNMQAGYMVEETGSMIQPNDPNMQDKVMSALQQGLTVIDLATGQPVGGGQQQQQSVPEDAVGQMQELQRRQAEGTAIPLGQGGGAPQQQAPGAIDPIIQSLLSGANTNATGAMHPSNPDLRDVRMGPQGPSMQREE